jgi:hypothetical protein
MGMSRTEFTENHRDEKEEARGATQIVDRIDTQVALLMRDGIVEGVGE